MENVTTVSFGEALRCLENGERVSRLGWHGKGMYLGLQRPDENSANTLPYIYICIPNGGTLPDGRPTFDRVPWLASQTDMLAEDWAVN